MPRLWPDQSHRGDSTVTEQEMVHIITETLDEYHSEVEPGDEDTDDMAYVLVRALKRNGLTL